MKFKEYEMVKVMINCNSNVKKGDIGAIIMVFNEPNEAYEVEFLDSEGYHKAQCTLLPDELEKVEATYRPE